MAFRDAHKVQLRSIGMPDRLWDTLYKKFQVRLLDLGEFGEFHMEERSGKHEEEGVRTKVYTVYMKEFKYLMKERDVYFLDHVWKSDGCKGAKHDLLNDEKLVIRLESILDLQHCSSRQQASFVDSHQVAAVMKVANVSGEIARRMLNSTHQELIPSIMNASESSSSSDTSSRESKRVTFDEFKAAMKGSFDDKTDDDEHMERLYTGFLQNQSGTARQEGRRECYGYSWIENQDDNTITVTIGIPRGYNKKDIDNRLSSKMWKFGVRECGPIIDGQFYHSVVSNECFWMIESNGDVQMTIQKANSDTDAWPYLLAGERHLDEKEAEMQRLEVQCSVEARVDNVLHAMWRSICTFQAVTSEGQQSRLWYMMDELGCGMPHSWSPNFHCAPFMFPETGKSYSLLWPAEDIEPGDMFTKDCCPRLSADETQLQMKARALAYQETVSCPSEFVAALSASRKLSEDISASQPFVRVPITQTQPMDSSPAHSVSRQFKLFVDTERNAGDWSRDVMSLVSNATEADVVWITDWSSVDASQLTRMQCVTRLVGDECLTRKDMLMQTLSVAGLSHVDWLPVTYDITSQLPELIADHENRGMFDWWIVKRSSSSHVAQFPVVTDDVRRIIRLVETGPCVASYFYLSSALFNDKRIALGYSVVVHTVDPLKLFVHTIPSVRVCERAAGNLSDYDHYDCSSLITSPTCVDVKWDDVKSRFEKQLEGRRQQWSDIEMSIHQLIADVFSAARGRLSAHPVCQCLGLYEVNILLLSSFQPLLLSIDPLPARMPSHCMPEVLSLLCQLTTDDQETDCYHNFVRLY